MIKSCDEILLGYIHFIKLDFIWFTDGFVSYLDMKISRFPNAMRSIGWGPNVLKPLLNQNF